MTMIFVMVNTIMNANRQITMTLFALINGTIRRPLAIFQIRRGTTISLTNRLRRARLTVRLRATNHSLMRLLPGMFRPYFPNILFRHLPYRTIFAQATTPPLNVTKHTTLFTTLRLIHLRRTRHRRRLTRLARFLFRLLTYSTFFTRRHVSPTTGPHILNHATFLRRWRCAVFCRGASVFAPLRPTIQGISF